VPTFGALGFAESSRRADEGWGARPVPTVFNDTDLAGAYRRTIVSTNSTSRFMNDIAVDHGLTVRSAWCSAKPREWPCKVIPLASTSPSSHPSGTAAGIGRGIRDAVLSYPEDLDVQVWGTGGMSHQLQGPRPAALHQSRIRQHVPSLRSIFRGGTHTIRPAAQSRPARYLAPGRGTRDRAIMWLGDGARPDGQERRGTGAPLLHGCPSNTPRAHIVFKPLD